MLKAHQQQAALELARSLAEDIAQVAPECADKALQILSILEDLDAGPDRGTIEDVIEAETLDSGLSDTGVRTVAAAVTRALTGR